MRYSMGSPRHGVAGQAGRKRSRTRAFVGKPAERPADACLGLPVAAANHEVVEGIGGLDLVVHHNVDVQVAARAAAQLLQRVVAHLAHDAKRLLGEQLQILRVRRAFAVRRGVAQVAVAGIVCHVGHRPLDAVGGVRGNVHGVARVGVVDQPVVVLVLRPRGLHHRGGQGVCRGNVRVDRSLARSRRRGGVHTQVLLHVLGRCRKVLRLRAAIGNDEAVLVHVHHVAVGVVERERQRGRDGVRRWARTDVVVRPLGDHLLGRGRRAGLARGRGRLARTRRRHERAQRRNQLVHPRLVGGVGRCGNGIGALGIRRKGVARKPPKGQHLCTRGHAKHNRARRAVFGRLHDPVDLGRLVLHQRRVQKHGKRCRPKGRGNGCGSIRGRAGVLARCTGVGGVIGSSVGGVAGGNALPGRLPLANEVRGGISQSESDAPPPATISACATCTPVDASQNLEGAFRARSGNALGQHDLEVVARLDALPFGNRPKSNDTSRSAGMASGSATLWPGAAASPEAEIAAFDPSAGDAASCAAAAPCSAVGHSGEISRDPSKDRASTTPDQSLGARSPSPPSPSAEADGEPATSNLSTGS